MSNGIEVLVSVLLLGIVIGFLISNDVSCFTVEVTPNNSLKASIALNKPALPC